MLLSISPIIFVSSLLLFNSSSTIFISLFISSSNSFFHPNISILIDWTSLMFLSTILIISASALMFSVSYIPTHLQKRYAIILIIFIISMILLIKSNNLLFMLLGWDGLGLSSFILVIFFSNAPSSSSGLITILSNRIGDICIIISIPLLIQTFSLNFPLSSLSSLTPIILLCIASFTKSAMLPFSAWLPAAMAAPTPISALVHSSTLVTAGIFILIRLLPPISPPSPALLFTALSTLLIASITANWEQDMKKIIAYSTLSQIAMMLFSLSMGLPQITFFHLITHALFKSTMFFSAGNFIYYSSYQDTRMISHLPQTNTLSPLSLGLSSLSLAGIPFMAGFYSKDAILDNSSLLSLNFPLLFLLFLSIGLTIAYSFRMTIITLSSSMKSKPDNLSLSPTPLSIFLPLMSILSITSGALLSWLILPPFPSLTSSTEKILIIMFLSSGTLLGMFLSSPPFFSLLNHFPFSLAFLHHLSSSPFQLLNLNSSKFLHLDNSWHENLISKGPSLKIMSLSSSLPYTLLLSIPSLIIISISFSFLL